MASKTLTSLTDRWVDGTALSIYPKSNFASATPPVPGLAPIGSAVGSAQTLTGGSVTFAGLADNTEYVVTDASGSKYVSVNTALSSSQVNRWGTLANRPAASGLKDGTTYYATDDNGGRMYQVESGAWVLVAPRGAELGYQAVTGNVNITATSLTLMTGYTVTVSVASRPIRIQAFIGAVNNQLTTGTFVTFGLFEDGTQIQQAAIWLPASMQFASWPLNMSVRSSPAAGSHTYDLRAKVGTSQSATAVVAANSPAYLEVVEV